MKSCIHFLNTGHSDCIILESNSHYAMIDAAEDTDFPPDKPWLNLKGYEQKIYKGTVSGTGRKNQDSDA